MIELYLNRDNLDTFMTVQYSLDVSLDWFEKYISNETDFDSVEEFLDNYNSEDIEEIISELDYEGKPYSLQEEDRFSYYE